MVSVGLSWSVFDFISIFELLFWHTGLITEPNIITASLIKSLEVLSGAHHSGVVLIIAGLLVIETELLEGGEISVVGNIAILKHKYRK